MVRQRQTLRYRVHHELPERPDLTNPTITYGHGYLHDCDSFSYPTSGTADGGTATTTVDAERTDGDDYWVGAYIKYTSGDNAGEEKMVTGFDDGTNTLTHGDKYVLSDLINLRTNMDGDDAELSVLYSDVFRIKAVSDSVAELEECCYYFQPGITVDPDFYPKILFRYKTSVSPSGGFGAKIRIKYATGPTYDYVLGSASTPEFSTSWKTGTATLRTDKGDVENIYFYASEDDKAATNGTYYVYFDFVLFHKGTFTFPNVGEGMDFSPPPRYARIPIFGRVGDITQGGGSESATVTCSCDLDIGSETIDGVVVSKWKRPQGEKTKTDYVDGEVFYDIAHNSNSEPWQWLDTGTEQFKATLESPVFRRGGDGHHILDLLFREYRLSCASNETYYERFGLNL
jgi:hypothetical protein